MPGKPPEKKIEGKQASKPPSRKQMTALWAAVLTALGSQGIPKIVDLLENKPSIMQVQNMIAQQTTILTEAQHGMTDAIKEMDAKLDICRIDTEKLDERTEMLKEALRDCCSKTSIRERLEKLESSSGTIRVRPWKPNDEPPPPESAKPSEDGENVMEIYVRPKAAGGGKSAADRVEKVPDFRVQQQMQVQSPPM